MRYLVVLFLLLSLSACSSLRRRAHSLEQNMTKEQASEELGLQPNKEWKDDQGATLVRFEDEKDSCILKFSDQWGLIGTKCNHDRSRAEREETNARIGAALSGMADTMRSQRQQQERRAPEPAQNYYFKAPQQRQTNCTTKFVGGTAYSDCTSTPTGIDTSIYRQ